MAKKGKPENLKSWKPGESGNPAGKPKGAKNRKTIIKEMLEHAASEKFKGLGANAGIKSKTLLDQMVAAMVVKAMAGDVPAFKELMDSAFGKNTDVVESTSTSLTLEGKLDKNDEELLTHFYKTKGKHLTKTTKKKTEEKNIGKEEGRDTNS